MTQTFEYGHGRARVGGGAEPVAECVRQGLSRVEGQLGQLLQDGSLHPGGGRRVLGVDGGGLTQQRELKGESLVLVGGSDWSGPFFLTCAALILANLSLSVIVADQGETTVPGNAPFLPRR